MCFTGVRATGARQWPIRLLVAITTRAGARQLLASCSAGQSAANEVHFSRVERRDRLRKKGLWNGAKVVEADRAGDRHSVVRSDLDLGLDPADRARDESYDDVSQSRQRFVAGEQNDRPATLVLELEPENVAACYQGSSRIASRALASAQASAVPSESSVWVQRSIASRSRTKRASAASTSASLSSSTS